jgi:UDP-3-O-[3-hydroxymyristoyl] glucosamine N-acyltransferase
MDKFMKRSVKELAALVNGIIIGDETTPILGVSSLEGAQKGDLVFVDNKKYLESALDSAASAIVCPTDITSDRKTLILVNHPKMAFARIVAELTAQPKAPPEIHPTAIIDKKAIIGTDVSIGPYCTIGKGTRIGARTVIGDGCSIGEDVEVGEDCHIYPRVVIYDRVKIRNRVIVHSGTVIGSDGFGYIYHEGKYQKFPQVGDVLIEEEVEIGSNVCIDRGALDSTIIGRGTKIDNLVQIAHNVRIGENCVLAAQVGVSGSSVIEDNVVVGGQVGIADHVRIQTGAIIGAQAGIPTAKIIRKGLTVWGTPARPIDEFKHIYAHTQNLPALKQRLIELEKKVAALEKERD